MIDDCVSKISPKNDKLCGLGGLVILAPSTEVLGYFRIVRFADGNEHVLCKSSAQSNSLIGLRAESRTMLLWQAISTSQSGPVEKCLNSS